MLALTYLAMRETLPLEKTSSIASINILYIVYWFLYLYIVLNFTHYIIVHSIFSSPDLEAHVSFSDHLASVVCPSIRLSVCSCVCLFACTFFTFSFFLQNLRANVIQTRNKASVSNKFKKVQWSATPISKEI